MALATPLGERMPIRNAFAFVTRVAGMAIHSRTSVCEIDQLVILEGDPFH